jgi:hypothetical protein
MLSYGATAEFSLVPSKDISEPFQNSPDLLLSFIIQFGVHPDPLADFSPPIVHFLMARRRQFLSEFAIKVTIFHLGSLQQHWNQRIVGWAGLLQQQWDR